MKKNKALSINLQLILTTSLFIITFVFILFFVSFFTFKRETTKAISKQNEEINRQIVYNYENLISKIIKTSYIISSNFRYTNIENNKNSSLDYLNLVTNYDSNILGITINKNKDTSIVETGVIDKNNKNWYQKSLYDKTILHFDLSNNKNQSYITISSYLINDYNQGLVLRIDYNFLGFIALAEKTNLGIDGHITIFDDFYNLVYSSSNNIDYGYEKSIFKELVLGNKSLSYNNSSIVLNIDTLAYTKWRIAIFSNVDSINVLKNQFLFNNTVISVLSLLLGITIFTLLSRAITLPLKKLDRQIKKTVSGQYLSSKILELKSNKEVQSLSNSYNNMVSEIKSLIEMVNLKHNEQRKSELKALQNQINPHFLYNTLDSILYLISKKENDNAAKMIEALSNLFRISISKGQNIITVEEELKHARSYLVIQSIRYKNSFTYEIDFDPSLKNQKTMKLIVQPFIENAIYHGLKNNIDKGLIKISVYKELNNIIFSISDNGYGMKKEKIDMLYESLKNSIIKSGVGIRNVYQRIKIYFGDTADIKIISDLDVGTTIKIIIPIRSDNND